jgi:rhodanese-related sulfurtransferase
MCCSPQEAHALMQANKARYLDVRTEDEFSNGHPVQSINIVALNPGPGGMKPNPNFLAEVEKQFSNKDEQILVGCAMGPRATAAASWLDGAGYTAVSTVDVSCLCCFRFCVY